MRQSDHWLGVLLRPARLRDDRKSIVLVAFIGLVALATLVSDSGGAMDGVVPPIGRVTVGMLGLAAAVLLYFQPRRGWLIAMAWALIQMPVFATSPDGNFTAQALKFPLAMTNSTTINGHITSYSSISINLVSVIVTFWLRAWRDRFA